VKYGPDYPTVSIIHGVPGRVMTLEQPQHMGLLAEPEPVKEWTPSMRNHVGTRGRSWPDYARCLAGAPPNRSGTGPDRSLADYTFAKFAAQRGFTVHEIAAELPNVSSKARERIANRDPGYVIETAKNGHGRRGAGTGSGAGPNPYSSRYCSTKTFSRAITGVIAVR
jgi:hypothetical protein